MAHQAYYSLPGREFEWELMPHVGWKLDPARVAQLEAASLKARTYPYWHQAQFAERNPFPTAKPPRPAARSY
ncbi:MAG: hypothetical protein ABI821_17045 [Pseudomonadota bacterium]